MLFNEIIDTHGVEGIASKTNISAVNLEYLVEEKFEKLNRVKALGFLLILEREYKEIDVEAFRTRIKEYYTENDSPHTKVVMVATNSVESGFSFFKFFIIIALLGGGFYLYTQGKLDSLLQQIEEKKDFFDDKKALENNVSIENADKVVVGKSQTESVSIETPVAPEVETIVLNNETDKESLKEGLTQVQPLLSASEKAAKKSKEDENKSIEEIVKEVSEDFLAQEENASLSIKTTSKVVEAETKIVTVNINPTRGMLWFGFINLDTKKRREFMKKVSTPFNIDTSRWLLVTGHGYVDVVTEAKTLELADNKKHYFYIDNSEIREINKVEYRKLNGNRGW